jgi:hypothetical protein
MAGSFVLYSVTLRQEYTQSSSWQSAKVGVPKLRPPSRPYLADTRGTLTTEALGQWKRCTFDTLKLEATAQWWL